MEKFVCNFIKEIRFSREIKSFDPLHILIDKAIIENTPDPFIYSISPNISEDIYDKVGDLIKAIEVNILANLNYYKDLKVLNSLVETKNFECEINFVNRRGNSSNWTIDFKLISKDYTVLTIGEKYVEIVDGNLLAFEPSEKAIIKLERAEYDKLGRIIISPIIL